MKRKFYIFMALLSGLIFGLSLFYYLQLNKPEIITRQTKPLVVAASEIPARSMVQKSQLMLVTVPEEGYPQGGASSIEEIAGKIVLVQIKTGDVLLAPMLGSPKADGSVAGSLDLFSFTVPEGKRAMAIPIGLISSVGYKVRPGDRVDILVTMDIKEDQIGTSYTILAAQDVLVLNTSGSTSQESGNTQYSDSYILALSVPQAMAVTLGSEKGSIRLLLRNPANKEFYQETPIDPKVFLNPNYYSYFN